MADGNSPVALYIMARVFDKMSQEPEDPDMPRKRLQELSKQSWEAARAFDPKINQVPLVQSPTPANSDNHHMEYNSMNEKQRTLLITTMVIIVAMFLFPPYHLYIEGHVFDSGYAFLFKLPTNGQISSTINISTLGIQWIGVLICSAISYFILKDR